jgi:serine/threonine protein kinase/tetratricopeptide (TPR) repeat protein
MNRVSGGGPFMDSSNTDRDIRIVDLLDRALAELQDGKTFDIGAWQERFPEITADLPELLQTLRDLETSVSNWKVDIARAETQVPGAGAEAPTSGYDFEMDASVPDRIGRYRIIACIGSGGMGTVYKAHDPQLDRPVALKVPRLEKWSGDRSLSLQRFLREARAAAQVRHANVCPIYDVGEFEGSPYVVMAFVDGHSLAERLRGDQRYDDSRQAVMVARQVAEALTAVHAHRIIHRDLKPGNILIDLTGQALLTDFGIARFLREQEHLTAAGAVLGTAAYMAPEQAEGQSERIGAWSDLYSLGAVLFQMLTGRVPFEPLQLGIPPQTPEGPPPKPSAFRSDVDPALEAIVQKSLAFKPEARFQSAREFATVLDRWLQGKKSLEGPTSTAQEFLEPKSPSTVVRTELADGGALTIALDHGERTVGKVAVDVKQTSRKIGKRRQLILRVAISFVVLFAFFGIYRVTRPLDDERLVGAKKAEPASPPLAFRDDGKPLVESEAKFTAIFGKTHPADQELMDKVSRRLLAVMGTLPDDVLPPAFDILDDDRVNAGAAAEPKGEGPEARILPHVVILSGLLNRVVKSKDDPDSDPDRLAFILGHELGHVVLRHIVRPREGKTGFLQQVFSRDQECAADLKGMEISLKAGFSFRRGRTAIDRVKQLGLNYSSFEGLGVDHPSWSDRLALMDREQAALWKAMSSFENGAFFLLFEQYASAERCFREVTKEFPACYEAWTNLGDALLMQYCDALDTNDLRSMKVGQIAVGGFYSRPESLEGLVRGTDEKLWNEAIECLEKALKLKQDLVLAKANLGVAYLVSPFGKDVQKATRYLREAQVKTGSEKNLSPFMKVAVSINLGVAELAAGHNDAAERGFSKAEEIGDQHAESFPRAPVTGTLYCALLYNRALLLAQSPERSQKRRGREQFERYLQDANPASSWWPLAYENYARLCQDLKIAAKSKNELSSGTQMELRPVTSVKLASGTSVVLGEPAKDVISRLGEGEVVPVVRGTQLAQRRYPAQGIELLTTDRVLVIRLRGPTAPPVPVQGAGPGGEIKRLSVGMSQVEFERALREQESDLKQLEQPGVNYRFYPRLALAVRMQNDKVEELVIAVIPRARTER